VRRIFFFAKNKSEYETKQASSAFYKISHQRKTKTTTTTTTAKAEKFIESVLYNCIFKEEIFWFLFTL
jgi:hypothetical protein